MEKHKVESGIRAQEVNMSIDSLVFDAALLPATMQRCSGYVCSLLSIPIQHVRMYGSAQFASCCGLHLLLGCARTRVFAKLGGCAKGS
mmetsp:Transcript_132993/g.331821  ORF Transcript_132993/g.331821 Transcript_132993/m.331821 type:complete len:88 (+) Transcript_132993:677-940(+)